MWLIGIGIALARRREHPPLSALAIFSTLIQAGLWVGILFAIFGWRRQP